MPDRWERRGRLAAASGPSAELWSVVEAELSVRSSPARVVDVGGGTGGFAVPLAEAGHQVTVVDPSPDALAALGRRAAESGVAQSVTAVQGDADQLVEAVGRDSVDVVLCHSVLEQLEDPSATLATIAGVVRPGGVLSVLAANRVAAVLARAVSGDLRAAERVLAGEGRRYFDLDELTALVAGAGWAVEAVHGVKVFTDLVASGGAGWGSDPEAVAALYRLESGTRERAPYRDMAAQLHVWARRGA